jgi:hypothetical protein
MTAGDKVFVRAGVISARPPPSCYNGYMSALSTSLTSTNPFFRRAYRRYFAENNLPVPKEESTDQSDPMNDLRNKQKWKMLKTLPGHRPDSTWTTMKVLNAGLSPSAKSAGWRTKALVGGGLVAGGAGAFGAYNQLGKTLTNANTTIDTANKALKQVEQTGQSFNDVVKPFADTVSSLGHGFAGLLGVQGYNAPDWWNRLRAYCKQWYTSTIYSSLDYGQKSQTKC